jgi:hypothetical protein
VKEAMGSYGVLATSLFGTRGILINSVSINDDGIL